MSLKLLWEIFIFKLNPYLWILFLAGKIFFNEIINLPDATGASGTGLGKFLNIRSTQGTST